MDVYSHHTEQLEVGKWMHMDEDTQRSISEQLPGSEQKLNCASSACSEYNERFNMQMVQRVQRTGTKCFKVICVLWFYIVSVQRCGA